MTNYLYKIEAINKATSCMFEPVKYTDVNKFTAGFLLYSKISSVIYLYKKVGGKWIQTDIIKVEKVA